MKADCLRGVEATLFDFEGTLVDFQWDLRGAVQETLEMLRASGLPVDTLREKKYSRLMSDAMKVATEIGESPESVREKIGTVYDRFDEDALSRWTLRPQAVKLLKELKSQGIKTALVSNVGKKALERAFLKLNLQGLFDVLVSRNDIRNLKPSGEGIQLALKRLQVIKEKGLYIGDSLDDLEAARDAGLKVVLLSGGENDRRDLLLGKPDGLIQDLGELLHCLRETSP